MVKDNDSLEIEANDSFQAYNEYTKTLRLWFVTYGIGGPILLVSQQNIADKIASAPNKIWIVGLFLGGLAIQILIAMINKWINWASYSLALNPPKSLSWLNKFCILMAKQFWLDLIIDILSGIAFFVATYLILKIILQLCRACKSLHSKVARGIF